jgi:hypothetical protein
MLRFIRVVAVCGMVLASLCYLWDVCDHWRLFRSLWRGSSFNAYQDELRALLDHTLSRNMGFCLAGIAFCFAGRMAARNRARQLAAEARARAKAARKAKREAYWAPLRMAAGGDRR